MFSFIRDALKKKKEEERDSVREAINNPNVALAQTTTKSKYLLDQNIKVLEKYPLTAPWAEAVIVEDLRSG